MSTDEGIFNMSQSSSLDFESVAKWTILEVAEWLRRKGHAEDIVNVWIQQKIDGKSLLVLTESDLKEPPIQILILGDLKRLYFDILELQRLCSPPNFSRLTGHSPPFVFLPPLGASSPAIVEQESSIINSVGPNCSVHNGANGSCVNQQKRRRKKRRVSLVESDSSQLSDAFPDVSEEQQRSTVGDVISKSTQQQVNHELPNRRLVLGGYATTLKPEIGKVILALGYVFVVTWVTSLTMVVVHDRVPSMEKFPPLPDLFLDNIPHIPYAFEMCEITGTILFCLFLGVLFFHKHRFILIRRFFALSGTVFLLRCVTMLITSLSVPGAHLKCNPRPYGDWFQRLYYAYLIWKGAGMSIQGVRTCGDYMFSGHTVALTMLNFFVTEYTTRRMYYLHTLSWLLNMFGIFFILAAHEHYSIDVFIAFYITSRLFLYYHTLANNQALMQRDSKRTKVWFPLFSFFESQVDGIVPNQYEWPITIERLRNWTLLGIKTMENIWKDFVPNPNEGFLRTKFFVKPAAATSVKKDE